MPVTRTINDARKVTLMPDRPCFCAEDWGKGRRRWRGQIRKGRRRALSCLVVILAGDAPDGCRKCAGLQVVMGKAAKMMAV
jgi:hypothetical protein